MARFNSFCHKLEVMQTMNISLPDALKEYVDRQIAQGRYSTASEYVRELIREDEKRRAQERIEALLLEGLEGKEGQLTRQDFDAIRRKALARLKRHKKKEG